MKIKFRGSDLMVAKGRRFAWLAFSTWILLLFSGTTGAAEWVIFHTSPDGDRYSYDASKLTIGGNEITYWKKVRFQSAQPYKGSLATSAMYRERINCAEHTLKPLNHVIHAASSAVIEQVATESEAAAIVPETVGDVFEQTLCPILKSRHEEPQPKPHPQPPAKVREKIEPPAAPAKEKIEVHAPVAKERTEAPIPSEKERIDTPTPPVKEKIEMPAPPAKAKIEVPLPPAKAKIEVPLPPAKAKIEVSPPPAKAIIEVPPPPAKAIIEVPPPPAKTIVEEPAPPAKAKIEAPAPPIYHEDTGLI